MSGWMVAEKLLPFLVDHATLQSICLPSQRTPMSLPGFGVYIPPRLHNIVRICAYSRMADLLFRADAFGLTTIVIGVRKHASLHRDMCRFRYPSRPNTSPSTLAQLKM
eukprot:3560392-Amphidinium_carterae.1